MILQALQLNCDRVNVPDEEPVVLRVGMLERVRHIKSRKLGIKSPPPFTAGFLVSYPLRRIPVPAQRHNASAFIPLNHLLDFGGRGALFDAGRRVIHQVPG
ncbi:hypothetical protein D1872_281000 [compost metagenome]